MPAPAIKISKWVKGNKVEKWEKGKVYVVEFWATWCGPCKVSIPHLTELAKKHKGKVTVIGVDSFEDSPENLANVKGEAPHVKKVEAFVKDMGAKMDYVVGIDGNDMFMAKNWMDAALQDGIPTAFVIDKDGTLAWIGHPMNGLDDVLDKVLSGKWDTKAEAKKQEEAEQAAGEALKKYTKAQELIEDGKYKEAVDVLNELMASSPAAGKNALMPEIYKLMTKYDEPGAYAAVESWLKKGDMDSSAMNDIAWEILTVSLQKADYDLAFRLATKAVEKSESKDGMIMDTLALATFKKGDVAKAIELQQKAIALVKAMNQPALAETLQEMEERLKTYQKAKGG